MFARAKAHILRSVAMGNFATTVLQIAAAAFLLSRAWRGLQNLRYDRWLIQAQQWADSPGEVVRTQSAFPSSGMQVRYRYHTAQGVLEGCCRVELPHGSSGRQRWNDAQENEEAINEIRATYVPGMQVTVRYDPHHPTHSVLWY
jgi:hypothetical protein